MNRAIDLWKEVPGVSDEVSDETESKSSSSRGKQPKNSLFLDFFFSTRIFSIFKVVLKQLFVYKVPVLFNGGFVVHILLLHVQV